jgi:segregation and condensation protein B
METLAVVAYRQPVTKAEIDAARGVDSAGTLRVLLDRDLVRPAGRKQVPGRPILYATTRTFLKIFQLKEIELLPDLKEVAEGEKSSAQD